MLIQENIMPRVNKTPPPLIPHPAYPKRTKIKKELQALINKALKCQRVKELAETGCTLGDPLHGKKGPLQVVYDPHTIFQMHGTTLSGFCDHTNRFVVLGTLDKVKGLNVLIFEIVNLTQTAEFRQAQQQIKDGTLNPDGYVKKNERIEFTTCFLHHKIAQFGIANLKWPKELDTFEDCKDGNFERAWHERIRFSKHAQLFRKQYADLTNTPETTPGFAEWLESTMICIAYRIQDIVNAILYKFLNAIVFPIMDACLERRVSYG